MRVPLVVSIWCSQRVLNVRVNYASGSGDYGWREIIRIGTPPRVVLPTEGTRRGKNGKKKREKHFNAGP